jgi:hypothetical protein
MWEFNPKPNGHPTGLEGTAVGSLHDSRATTGDGGVPCLGKSRA